MAVSNRGHRDRHSICDCEIEIEKSKELMVRDAFTLSSFSNDINKVPTVFVSF